LFAKIYGVTYKNQLVSLEKINQKTQFIKTAVKMGDRFYSPDVSLTSFVGREKSGNHKWTSQEMNLPNYFSMLIYFQVL
jgi:hypothetical protein